MLFEIFCRVAFAIMCIAWLIDCIAMDVKGIVGFQKLTIGTVNDIIHFPRSVKRFFKKETDAEPEKNRKDNMIYIIEALLTIIIVITLLVVFVIKILIR